MRMVQPHNDTAVSGAKAVSEPSKADATRRTLRAATFDEGEAMLKPEPSAPETKGVSAPTAQGAPKKIFGADGSLKILNDVYGGYKTFTKGDVRLLDQAAFQAAYDAIYGGTEHAWERRIAPGPGNLEGFAHDGVSYVNKALARIDTVPHEMLHNNAAEDFADTVGHQLSEGVTEYLTIKAVTKFGQTPTRSYPQQEACVQELLAQGLPESALLTAYFRGDAATLVCGWIDQHCSDTFWNIKQAMEGRQFAVARAKMQRKQ